VDDDDSLRFKNNFKRLITVLLFAAMLVYPALVYYSLVIRKIPIQQFSLFVVIFAVFAFIIVTTQKKSVGYNFLILFCVGILCLFLKSEIILKLYPVLMNAVFLAAFGITLFFRPNMIFRFASMQDKSVKGSLGEKRVEKYCYSVTIAWCVFFIFNGSIAAWTVFYGNDILWSVYNGGISYLLIGLFFSAEFIIRKIVQKNMPKAVPLSKIKEKSRCRSMVLCYDGVYKESNFKTWGDFLDGTAILRSQIEKNESKRWLLYCEDNWLFLLAFTALLQCKKEILLSANVSPEYIAEIRDGVPFLTDRVFKDDKESENTFNAALLLETKQPPAGKIPEIINDETSIVMYTSGSTGKPKDVKQRLTEFENDNSFILSKWGQEILKRKICSTVNQHHIYGLLYSVLLPFTAGVPFRRSKIEFPEELEKLNDAEYMLITVPAFLKRAVEIEKKENLRLKSPWIFSSGGVLDPAIAQRTNEIFGFWPLEVYGSTETSGIAYRQSVNGLEWTPFSNALLSKNADDCLVIRSPYIRDQNGFETADMVQILEDGRFLLKGRIDSVVKIEEKRISLAEIETRILQSGFVSDVCVVSMEGKRQYLAAVLVFNKNGKDKFTDYKKHDINLYWREYLLQYFENVVIPKKWRYQDIINTDAQGKKKKDDIRKLFTE